MAGCLSCQQDDIIEPFISPLWDNNDATLSEQDANILAFFEEQVPWSYGFLTPLCIFGDNPPLDNQCMVINSMDELREVFLCLSIELPEIDFNKHTLIIGRISVSTAEYSVAKQDITIKPDKLILRITADGTHAYMMVGSQLNYWGLYPKLPDKPLVTNITITK